ncbi:MAG: ABC transporter permease [Clostridiales bacterium]|uniref:permease-like cell division protein FtsX n=1 Tax=Clostridium sp. N3C TaxID=1776758 RepID=UPI00092E0216|nr:permease-like cell division protein FtsX [Clostridium sp. N3C]NLZ48568.1 ABC transporter permease [Clostridiales bacterium]SCN25932.1 Cell division protein FtsX [Clostridium sp. N3C]
MRISTFRHFFADAFKSLKRNITMSFASIMTVAATLFIFGVFLLLMINANKLMGDLEDKVQVKVFLKNDISFTEQKAIEDKLNSNSNVERVVYESKDEAFENMKNMMGEDYESVLSGYTKENHPFPAAYVVHLKNVEAANEIEENFKDMSGVDDIGNDRPTIEAIINVSKTLKWVGVFMFALLGGVSLFLIVNTIRLTVFSRRREVGIMKFVGATDWFIRWPFIIEGIVIGLIGAFISTGVLKLIYGYFVKSISKGSLIAINLVESSYVITHLSWSFALAGMLIGAVGSVIALRKFLVV